MSSTDYDVGLPHTEFAIIFNIFFFNLKTLTQGIQVECWMSRLYKSIKTVIERGI